MFRLIIAITLTLLLLLTAIFAPLISPYTPTFQEISIINPGKLHILGTDRWGYDLLTLMLHGLRYTLLFAVGGATLRVTTGLISGLCSSLFHRESKLNLPGLNAIPPFIIVYFLLYRITINSSLPVSDLLIIQFIIITVVGLPSINRQMENNSRLILKEGFIEAAYSAGAGNYRVLTRHVLPQLREKVVLSFISEMIHILNLIGQLGIFHLFIGGTKISFDPLLYHSITNEIAGLIGQNRLNIDYNQWYLLSPLGLYLIVLFIFYFLQNSIENYYRVRSKIYTHL